MKDIVYTKISLSRKYPANIIAVAGPDVAIFVVIADMGA